MPRKLSDPWMVRMGEFLAGEHFRYRRFAFAAEPGEVELGAEVGLVVEAPETPLVAQMVADLRAFCERCLGVRLVEGRAGQEVRLRLRGRGAERDVLDPRREAFELEVSEAGVTLEAEDERGLLQGTHYLERLMADRGGPYLQSGRRELRPRFAPRITKGMEVAPEHLDAYLSLLSHFGANGLHTVATDLTQFTNSAILPELNRADWEANLAGLATQTERYLRHGLDLYLVLDSPLLPRRHPVFETDPTRRGAPHKVVLNGEHMAVLCSSNEEVRAYYEEAVESLFRQVPELGGAVMIVGGEGFMHCFSRPFGKSGGYSSCPQCRDLEPSGQVARLTNLVAAAVKRANPRKPLFAWPYAAFGWSGAQDRAQQEWIARLSEDVAVLSTFDTGSEDETGGAGVYLIDYNIKTVGPSAVFRAQAEQLQSMGRPIYAKTETNATPSLNTFPYIPVHYRWHGRFQEIDRSGAAGFMGQWDFYLANGSLPEELQYHTVWNPTATTDELLARVVRRDFGLTGEAAAEVLAGWRKMSEAGEDFPYSAMTAGERAIYYRGPLQYGPAHPLIFNEQDTYGLSPAFFGLTEDLLGLAYSPALLGIDPDRQPPATPEEKAAVLRSAKPRYVCDLLLTLPYGTKRYLELIGRCRARWAEGVGQLGAALGPQPAERAQRELDLCTLVEIHLTTVENVVRFHEAREELWRERLSLEEFRGVRERLSEILRQEIANAERSLPILEREFRVWWYDRGMVEEKLRQCRFVLEEELPRFAEQLRWHVWNDYA